MLSKASGRDHLWKRVSGTEADPRPRDPRPHLAAPYELEEKGSVASPPESESPLSLGKGMGQAFVSVHVCAHGRNKVYGEGQGAPTSLSKSGHSGPPVPRILPSGVSLPPWSPSGLLTFLKACCWIPDSCDKVFIHSASRESRVMQRREGGGTDFGEGRGNHSGRKTVWNELFAYRNPPQNFPRLI